LIGEPTTHRDTALGARGKEIRPTPRSGGRLPFCAAANVGLAHFAQQAERLCSGTTSVCAVSATTNRAGCSQRWHPRTPG
jgi:hypothetical protein